MGWPVLWPCFREGCPLISVSSQPGWLCGTGMATSWITCPSQSSTTFSRASCTSTPRASGHGRSPHSPWASANTGPPAASVHPVSLPPPFFRLLILTGFPTLLTQPPQCGGPCREHHSVPLLRSHRWTNSSASPGWGWVTGSGVGKCTVLGDVRVSSPQHALGRRLGPSPSQHALYHKGYLSPFFLIFRFVVSFVGCCSCSLLIELGSNPCPAVLYVCRLVAFLRHSFPFDRIPRSQASALRKLCEGYAG